MLVSKAKAAKLAGVSRTTIHRYASNGRLSMTGDQVDTSELIRVFGQISEHPRTPEQVNTSEHLGTGGVQGGGQAQISMLEEQIRDLRQERDRWREKSDQLADLLKTEQENIRLITHQGRPKQETPLYWLLVGAILVTVVTTLGLLGWTLTS
jgi:hypothetical protein